MNSRENNGVEETCALSSVLPQMLQSESLCKHDVGSSQTEENWCGCGRRNRGLIVSQTGQSQILTLHNLKTLGRAPNWKTKERCTNAIELWS